MKLSQFTPETNRNILQGRITPSVTMESVGGDTSGARALGNALGAVAGVIEKQWTKDQNDKVFDALNDYEQQKNSALYDEKNGLFYTMQGKNAEGLQQAFQEQESKIRQSVIEKYGLSSNYAMSAFKKQIEPSYTSTLRSIDNQQRSEMEKYTANQDSVDFDNTINQMVGDSRNAVTFATGYLQRMEARTAGLGIDDAGRQVFKHGQLNKMADKALSVAVENNDYETGINLMAFVKSMGADASVINKFDNAFRKQKDVKIAANFVDQAIKQNPGMIYWTDKQIDDWYDKNHPWQETQGDIGNTIVDFVKNNYKLGDQWMGNVTDNPTIQCDSWTADAYKRVGLFPDGDITRASDFGDAYHKAGTGYTPQPGDFIDGEKHVGIYLGNNQYMARNSSGGIHIGSMEEWNEFFGAPIGYGSVGELKGSTSPEVAEARHNSQRAEFLNGIHKQKQAADQQNAQTMKGIRDTIIAMNQAGNSRQDIFNYLSNMKDMNPGLDEYSPFGNLLMSYSVIPKTNSSGGSGNGSSGGQTYTKMGAMDMRNAEALIGNGINSQDDLNTFIGAQMQAGRVFTDSQVVSLQNSMDDYTNGSGKYAVPIETTKSEVCAAMGKNPNSIKDLEYNVAKSQVKAWAVQYNSENGRWPSQVEIRNQLIEELTTDQLGGSEQMSRAQMGAAGIEYIVQNGDLKEVKFADNGRVYKLTDEQIDEITKGKASESDADSWDSANRLGG